MPLAYRRSTISLRSTVDVEADPKDRAWAANAAAPYLHARPGSGSRQPVSSSTCRTRRRSEASVRRLRLRFVKAVAEWGLSPPSRGAEPRRIMEAQRKAIETRRRHGAGGGAGSGVGEKPGTRMVRGGVGVKAMRGGAIPNAAKCSKGALNVRTAVT